MFGRRKLEEAASTCAATVVYLALVAVIIFAGIKGGMLIANGYSDFNSDVRRAVLVAHLPENVGISDVIASNSDDGWRESCFYALYRLDGGTLTAIRESGLGYLGTEARPKNDNPRNPYGAWHATPVVMDNDDGFEINGQHKTVHALHANWGCESGFALPPDWKGFNPQKALRESGGFYSVTGNREGMILIDTNAGVALVLYSG